MAEKKNKKVEGATSSTKYKVNPKHYGSTWSHPNNETKIVLKEDVSKEDLAELVKYAKNLLIK